MSQTLTINEAYPDRCDLVRSALDVSLDSTVLPDSVIGMSIYGGAAEAEVIQRVPDWATRSADQQRVLIGAVAFLTAARLVMAVPQITSERTPDGQTYSRAVMSDPVKFAANLRGLGGDLIAAVTVANIGVPERPHVFTTVGGRRGW